MWVLWVSRRGSGEDSLSRSEAFVREQRRKQGQRHCLSRSEALVREEGRKQGHRQCLTVFFPGTLE